MIADKRRPLTYLALYAAIAALLVALHGPLLRMPYHWDELGQFVPAARDILEDGAWVPHSALPNIHPPLLMAYVALAWKFFGFSIATARVAMLFLAAAGVLFSFLLAIRLARGSPGAPAFAAAAFLVAAPMFYTQSMMVLLDLPAMVLTALALLWFLDQRYAACAVATVVLVLTKETAITTPLIFAGCLWFVDRRRREALYFAAPVIALAGWLVVLHEATGSWFGNEAFAQYNVGDSLAPTHILYALARRVYSLLIADGHWIGAIALYFGWHSGLFRDRAWKIAGTVGIVQVLAVTLLGGAVLERYLLPVLPILCAAIAVAAGVYSARVRILSHTAMLVLMVAGSFIDPPYPFPIENNLSVVDFVYLQRDAAQYLESYYPDAQIASVWPFLDAVKNPDFGYVQRRLRIVQAPGLRRDDLAKLDLNNLDVLVLYSRGQSPPAFARRWLGRFIDPPPEANADEMETLGFVSQKRWVRGSHWIAIYKRR